MVSGGVEALSRQWQQADISGQAGLRSWEVKHHAQWGLVTLQVYLGADGAGE